MLWNETKNIVRMLNYTFDRYRPLGPLSRKSNAHSLDLRSGIKGNNGWMVPKSNKTICSARFVQKQEEYEDNCRIVVESAKDTSC